MDRTAATAHSEHDELLIARLFGGDVTGPERDRALDVMSECDECAAVFADLGAIEAASVEMAIPARPRDFAITAEDAARLRRKSRPAGLAGWAGLRRALGGSMAALGLVGLIATNLISGAGAGAGSGFGLTSNSQRDAAGVMADATAAPAAMPTSASTGNLGALGPMAASSGDHLTTDNSSPPVQPAASPPPATSPTQELAAASPGDKTAPSTPPNPAATRYVICCGQSADGSNGTGSVSVTPPSASSSEDPDARTIWLAGFGGLFVAGLIVLLIPLLRRARRSRGTPRG